MCRLFPTFHAERPSLSLFSQCKSLSSICYKVMSPLFRHGPMQTPPFKLHYPVTGRPKAESFLGNSERRFSLCPERPQCSQSCRARTLQQHRTSLDAARPVSFISLGYIQIHDKKKEEREKPELNRLGHSWHSWKSFTVLPSHSSSFTLVFVSMYIQAPKVRTWMAAAVFITNIPSLFFILPAAFPYSWTFFWRPK